MKGLPATYQAFHFSFTFGPGVQAEGADLELREPQYNHYTPASSLKSIFKSMYLNKKYCEQW